MTIYNDSLSQYITSLFAVHDAALKRAWEDSPKYGLPAISIKPEEGRFLQLLVRVCGAHKALEIGTLGGYSGIWIARGLLPGGKLVTLEMESKHADIAREHFKAAGLTDQVEIRVGNAHRLLAELHFEGPFDFIFIDAEKPGYLAYANSWKTFVSVVWSPPTMLFAVAVIRDARTMFIARRCENSTAMWRRRRLISTVYPAGDGTLISVKIA
jgi:caffeoyl-CoA O-methyltransferase